MRAYAFSAPSRSKWPNLKSSTSTIVFMHASRGDRAYGRRSILIATTNLARSSASDESLVRAGPVFLAEPRLLCFDGTRPLNIMRVGKAPSSRGKHADSEAVLRQI